MMTEEIHQYILAQCPKAMRKQLMGKVVVVHVLNLCIVWEIPREQIEQEGGGQSPTPPHQSAKPAHPVNSSKHQPAQSHPHPLSLFGQKPPNPQGPPQAQHESSGGIHEGEAVVEEVGMAEAPKEGSEEGGWGIEEALGGEEEEGEGEEGGKDAEESVLGKSGTEEVEGEDLGIVEVGHDEVVIEFIGGGMVEEEEVSGVMEVEAFIGEEGAAPGKTRIGIAG